MMVNDEQRETVQFQVKFGVAAPFSRKSSLPLFNVFKLRVPPPLPHVGNYRYHHFFFPLHSLCSGGKSCKTNNLLPKEYLVAHCYLEKMAVENSKVQIF